jgi:uncharacterized surface protein with fasciclin (FAS1) repeats
MRSLSLALLAVSFASHAVSIPCSAFSTPVSWFTGADEQFPMRSHDENRDTIYKTLQRKEEFSTLVKLIDKVEKVREILDSDKKLTFLAPNNAAFKKFVPPNRNEEEKRRMLEEMLIYQMIPRVIPSRDLCQNSTLATELQARDGSFDDAKRRVKVQCTSLQPPQVKINNYVDVIQKDIYAKNGVIHVIDNPLFVPPDIMDIMFLVPNKFSITATALLKTNLQNNYEYNSDYKRKDSEEGRRNQHNDRYGRGTPATTLIVPTNEAWNQLPSDLVLYLFSPIGERTLRKLMEFHTLPNNIVFTEYTRQSRRGRDRDFDERDGDLSFESRHEYETEIDQRMPVHVKKTRANVSGERAYTVTLQAHGVHATVIDNPAQNGVLQVVPQVLSPRRKEGVDEAQNAKDWQEWRQWLPEWSEEHRGGGSDRE